jgi:hypothetical protein
VRGHKRDLQHFLIRIPAAIHPRRRSPLFLERSMIEPQPGTRAQPKIPGSSQETRKMILSSFN